MDGARHQDAHGRSLHGEEMALAFGLDRAALAEPQLIRERARQRIRLELAGASRAAARPSRDR